MASAVASAAVWRGTVGRCAVSAFLFAVLAGAGWLAGVALVPHVATTDADVEAALVMHAHAAVVAMTAVSWLGSGVTLIAVGCVVGWVLVRSGRVADVTFLAVSGIGATMLSSLVKTTVHRARPSVAQVSVDGWSFPSGHATESMAFYGALAVVAVGTASGARRRALIIAAATLLVGAIAYSRLALGVHYPGDVLAGVTLGGLWLTVSAVVVGTSQHRRPPGTRRGAPSSTS